MLGQGVRRGHRCRARCAVASPSAHHPFVGTHSRVSTPLNSRYFRNRRWVVDMGGIKRLTRKEATSAMTSSGPTGVTLLGLGAMGSALAASLVCRRTPDHGVEPDAGPRQRVVARGAVSAPTVLDAVTASPVVVTCLYDHASVHQTLDPVAEALRGRTLVNVTTTTPNDSRAARRVGGRPRYRVPGRRHLGRPGHDRVTGGLDLLQRLAREPSRPAGRCSTSGRAVSTTARTQAGQRCSTSRCSRGCTRCSPASSTARRWWGPKV